MGIYLAIKRKFSYFVNFENTFAVQRYTSIDINGGINHGKLAVVKFCKCLIHSFVRPDP